jgi:hypothetical protein
MAGYQSIENQLYPDDVLNVVRNGYQYRVEAEKYCQNEEFSVHHCLVDAPGVINWLASLVKKGISWGAFKAVGRGVVEQFRSEKRKLPPMAKQILANQQDFRKLYDYVKEYSI